MASCNRKAKIIPGYKVLKQRRIGLRRKTPPACGLWLLEETVIEIYKDRDSPGPRGEKAILDRMPSMAAGQAWRTVSWSRRSPDPVLVRWLVGGVFLIGVLVAAPGSVLPVWSSPLPVDATSGSLVFAGLTLGLLAGILYAPRLRKQGDMGIRRLLTVSLACMTIAFVSLSTTQVVLRLFAGWFGLGVAGGGLVAVVSALLPHIVTPSHSITVLHLAGLTLGGAGVIVSLLFSFAMQGPGAAPLLLIMSSLTLVSSIWAWRSRALEGVPRPVLREFPLGGKDAANPVVLLLALSIVVQSASQWAVAGWLPAYLSRRFGLSAGVDLSVLAGFWLSLSLTRLLAGRRVNLGSPLRWLGGPTVASLAGCSLLLQFQDLSGAVAGLLLLGVGLGSLHPVTLTLMGRSYIWKRSGFVYGVLSLWLITGLPVSVLIGHFAKQVGIEVVVWIVAGNALLAFLLLATVLLETRLAKEARPVRH